MLESMLSKRQEQDSKKCEEMELEGADMECFGCSCSVCLAQQPDYYKMGFKKAVSMVKSEIEQTGNTAHKIVLESLLTRMLHELNP